MANITITTLVPMRARKKLIVGGWSRGVEKLKTNQRINMQLEW
ncbi:hypothetical protein GCM10022421_26220 [Oceanisphaera sediminis]|uniref:Uncharacterized protein n=1 Tax=Oceanisphaera sediminis TaxID=981381 RepID=A0ABP7EBW9_9GAMM